MTLDGLGQRIKDSKKAYERYGANLHKIPNETLAKAFLEANPDFADLATRNRYLELYDENTSPEYLFPAFTSNSTFNADRRDKIQTIQAEAQMLHSLEMLSKASQFGVPVVVLSEMALMQARTDMQILIMREELALKIAYNEHFREHTLKAAEVDDEISRRRLLGASEPKSLPTEPRKKRRKVGRKKNPTKRQPGNSGELWDEEEPSSIARASGDR